MTLEGPGRQTDRCPGLEYWYPLIVNDWLGFIICAVYIFGLIGLAECIATPARLQQLLYAQSNSYRRRHAHLGYSLSFFQIPGHLSWLVSVLQS